MPLKILGRSWWLLGIRVTLRLVQTLSPRTDLDAHCRSSVDFGRCVGEPGPEDASRDRHDGGLAEPLSAPEGRDQDLKRREWRGFRRSRSWRGAPWLPRPSGKPELFSLRESQVKFSEYHFV